MLQAAFGSMDDATLATPQPGTMLGHSCDLGQQLSTYPLHEMYHVGQISLARRILGLGPGNG